MPLPSSPATDELVYTPLKDIDGVVARCRDGARKQVLHSVEARKAALRAMYKMVRENEEAFLAAVHTDVGKHRYEATLMELSVCAEIMYLIDNVEDWAKEKPAPVSGPMKWIGCTTRYDPLGCALIIGAWNYPIMLTLGPTVGALAAGNTVVLKPSEVSPATAQLLARLVSKYFDPQVLSVVNGGVVETTALLENNVFDHIFYTGSGTVGKAVMTAAAKNLTPVCLELGGKSPTIVDETCAGRLDVVAARILWGKYTNSGQTCVAPDFLLIHESVKEDFIRAFREQRTKFMGGSASIAEDPSYPRMASERHFKRVSALLDGSCGKVVVGGETNPATLQIGVTLLDDVKLDSPLMTDEIFGPLLPMVTFKDKKEPIAFINARPKPLALYVFTTDKAFAEAVKSQTSSGGVVVNDVMLHVAAENLPFGGVGASGMGSYHGFASFKVFSHQKSIVNDTLRFEVVKRIRYPPFTVAGEQRLRRVAIPSGERSALGKAITRVAMSPVTIGAGCFAAGATATALYMKKYCAGK